MHTQEPKLRRSGIATTVSLLLLLVAGSALAATPATTDYRNASQPMITGTALMVNEHQLLVATEQGEEVLLALDSRTMVPVDLAPEMMMRVEFNYLDDGSRYAKRVIPIRHGQRTSRDLAYSLERHDDDASVEYATASAGGHRSTYHGSTAASVTNQPLDTPLKPIPATDEYVVATQPMIAGQVVAVNDHRIVIDTDQAQRVTVEMDSRTLVPSSLRSGMMVRVENRSMENGTRLATRITPARSYDVEGGEDMIYPVDSNGEPVAYNDTEASSTYESTDAQLAAAPGDDEAADRTYAVDEDRLPQTASRQPLIALVGFLALAAAGAVAMIRRRVHVG